MMCLRVKATMHKYEVNSSGGLAASFQLPIGGVIEFPPEGLGLLAAFLA